MALSLEEIVRRFEKPQRQGSGSYKVLCPAHPDEKQSLSISNGKEPGKIILFCHADCSTQDILTAAGLTWADIGEDRPETTWRSKLEQFTKMTIEAVYDYKDEKGKYLYSKIRFQGKKIRYGILDREKDIMKLTGSGAEHTLYNLPDLVRSVKGGYPVYIVEGEKDVETLRKLGMTATTAGAVTDWRREYAHYFTGARVTILPDNDDKGLDMAEKIRKDLRHYAHSIRVVKLPVPEKGDVTDYIEEGHTKDELMEVVNEEVPTAAPWIYFTGKEDNKVMRVNEDKLAESILKTVDYAMLKDTVSGSELFYIYRNGVYRRCGKSEIKALARKRVPFGVGKDDIFGKTANLLMYSGDRVYSLNEINQDEWVVNVKNGLYDVKKKKLLPHSSSVLSTIQLDCSWPEEYRKPVRWIQFIEDLCRDEDGNVDYEMVAMLQEWLGASISNVNMTRFKKCLVMLSLLGNTGKSVFLSVMRAIIGTENTANIPIQKMGDRWSGGEIYGKRLIIAGDQSSDEIRDSSVFKQLTGGDALKAEIKGQMAFSFVFRGSISMACNDLPSFQDDKGGHIFERLLLAHCRNVIPEEKRDGTLIDKLLEEKDQIFRWAMEGLDRLTANGLKFSPCVSSDLLMTEYRSRLDTVYRFIHDNCEITGDRLDRIRKSEFEEEYRRYCTVNGIDGLAKKNIKERVIKNSIQFGKVGELCYKGVKWKDFRTFYDPEASDTF